MDYEDILQVLVEQYNDRTFDREGHAYIADDIHFRSAGTGRELHGIDAFIGYQLGFIAALPDAQVAAGEIEIDGDQVWVAIHASGTFTGEMTMADGSVVPGTGNYAEWVDNVEMTFRDGKVVSWVSNVDMQDVMGQLGIG
jgi:predicted ester cyclase